MVMLRVPWGYCRELFMLFHYSHRLHALCELYTVPAIKEISTTFELLHPPKYISYSNLPI